MRLFNLFLAVVLCVSALPATAKEATRGSHAMVATEQHYATQIGVNVLRAGGNAVDAAVAIGYALAVVDPCCGNIGGGGFMLIRAANGAETFIAFREAAPGRSTANMYLNAAGEVIKGASTKSYLAVGVPGTVMGLEYARIKKGTQSRRALMEPAIALARDGYVVDAGDTKEYAGSLQELNASPEAKAIFTHDGRVYSPGERLVQAHLAHTLQLIERGGTDAFYRGPIARTLVAQSALHGGILTMSDFATYRVEERNPVHCRYRGYRITSAPPPSSGGITLCEILNIIEPFPFGSYGWNSSKSIHTVVEAERRAYADRNTYLGDPNFVKNPIDDLLSPTYAAKLRAQILPDRATPSSDVQPGLGPIPEHLQTTHYSVVDRFGNAVAVTYTINDAFGSDLVAGDTGFLLNNEMDDFTSKPGVPNSYGLVQGVRNAVSAHKRPLSSMSPTIITKDGKLFMVTGSPGGSRIITITLNTIQNVIDYGMNVQDAVDAPRFHHQWLPDLIHIEPGAVKPPDRAALAAMGYAFKEYAGWGSAQAIVVDPKTHMRYGGTDRRHSSGAAIGY
ncbi:MAG: gamma-glutamyltransferase [Vulcanimicrobiaceae bacterium]